MTKKLTSEDCEGNIEDIEDGRYNSHVVPVSAEDDPGYEELDYSDCTEFTVPLGRYGSHVVPIGGAGGGVSGAACPNGGLKGGTTIDGKACLSLNLKPGGAIILQGGQLAIDTSKLKITTDQVFPSSTDTGIVIDSPGGESWDTQYDYNQWLYGEQEQLKEDQERQDDLIDGIVEDIAKWTDPADNSTHYRFVTHHELDADQKKQNTEWEDSQEAQDEAFNEEIDLLKTEIGFVDNTSKARDAVLEAEILLLAARGKAKQKKKFIKSDSPSSVSPYPGYKVKDDKTLTFCVQPWDPLPVVGDELACLSVDNPTAQEVMYVSPKFKMDHYDLIEVELRWSSFGLDAAQLGDEAEFELTSNQEYVSKNGDEMSGKLIAPRFQSRFVDSGEKSNLNLQYNGDTKVYVGGTQVTIQPPLKLNTEGVEAEHAVTKGYVDNLVIELEEEIDAIAPSTERGHWAYTNTGVANLPGSYSMYSDMLSEGLGDVASIFAAVENFVINQRDLEGNNHAFNDVQPGQLLEVFEEGDSDYGLYEIIEVQQKEGGTQTKFTYWSLDVKLVRTGSGDKAETRARFKIFSPPSGGEAGGFVMKSGDTITGPITIDDPSKLNRDNHLINKAYVDSLFDFSQYSELS